jgi:hypothetical protein
LHCKRRQQTRFWVTTKRAFRKAQRNEPKPLHYIAEIGRVAIRKTGSFNIQTGNAVVQGINHKRCRILQRGDGYGYLLNTQRPAFLPQPDRAALPKGLLRKPVDQGWGIQRSI